MQYAIYCDGKPLYVYNSSEYTAVQPTLTQEVNKAGSLEFSMLPEHPLYDSIQQMRSVIQVLRDGKEIWSGRALNDNSNFYNINKIYCEGVLAYLNDSQQFRSGFRGTAAQYFERLITDHNLQMWNEPQKQFSVGIMEIEGEVDFVADKPQNTWLCLEQYLIKPLGGYIRIRKENGINYLDYTKESGKHCQQKIEFGKNLRDLQKYTDSIGVYSVLIPLGARKEDGEYLTIEEANDGVNYIVDDVAVALYTRIVNPVEFSKITDAAELLAAGREALKKILERALTINLDAVDMSKAGVDTDTFECGDYIPVLSRPHKLDAEIICSKIVERLDVPDQTKYTLGAALSRITSR